MLLPPGELAVELAGELGTRARELLVRPPRERLVAAHLGMELHAPGELPRRNAWATGPSAPAARADSGPRRRSAFRVVRARTAAAGRRAPGRSPPRRQHGLVEADQRRLDPPDRRSRTRARASGRRGRSRAPALASTQRRERVVLVVQPRMLELLADVLGAPEHEHCVEAVGRRALRGGCPTRRARGRPPRSRRRRPPAERSTRG